MLRVVRKPLAERSLALDRLPVAAVLAVALLALTACGRAGGLEPPPGPAVTGTPTAAATPPAPAAVVGGPVESGPAALEAAQNSGFDAYGNPVAPPGQKKSFLLDPLLQ